MSLTGDLDTLASDLATATGLPVYAQPGVGLAAGRAVWLYPPRIDFDEDLAVTAAWSLAKWTLPVVVAAAGPDSSQVRQLLDDAETVAAAVPRPWRVTALTPSVADADAGSVPYYALTLER